MKNREREKAIILRKKGFSYSEILKKINVAKSTLSLWLRSVGLSKQQKQHLTIKKLEAAQKGASRKKELRIERTKAIKHEAAQEIGLITDRELFLVGVALYWAEGSKEKEYAPGSGVKFSNSDPMLIGIFLLWLLRICKISKDRIKFEIYIHESRKDSVRESVKWWAQITNFSEKNFTHIYFKKEKKKTNRKNTGKMYFGQLLVRVRGSSLLNRKIAGWMEGMIHCLK